MKNNQRSKKWFSIVLAMWLTVVISLIAILILEFIIPFSRNVKSVENGSAAYYYAYGWVEDSLWELAKQTEDWYDASSILSTWSTWSKYDLISMTDVIPPSWDGNTDLNDKDWNKFDANTPIQLSLSDNAGVKLSTVDFWQTDFLFRVPDISWTGAKTLSWSTKIIVNWIVSGLNASGDPVVLNASWSITNDNYITAADINAASVINIWGLDGITLDGTDCTVQQFFSNSSCAWWVNTRPVLKLSIVNSLEVDTADGWWLLPYLEYQIRIKNNWWSPVNIPWRYSQIDTVWKSYWYKKTMDIKVPQLSTNQAFDFAVFQ